jgi:hypothetical protein
MHLKLILEENDNRVTGSASIEGATDNLAAMLVNVCFDNEKLRDIVLKTASALYIYERIPRLQIVEEDTKK